MDDPFCPTLAQAIRDAAHGVPGFRFRRVHGPEKRRGPQPLAGRQRLRVARDLPRARGLRTPDRDAGHHRRLREPGAGARLRDAPRLLPRRRQLGHRARGRGPHHHARPPVPRDAPAGRGHARARAARPRRRSRPPAAAGRCCGRGLRSTRGPSPRRRDGASARAPPPLLRHGAGGRLLSPRPVARDRARRPDAPARDHGGGRDPHAGRARPAGRRRPRHDAPRRGRLLVHVGGRAARTGLRDPALRPDRRGGERARRQHDAGGARRACATSGCDRWPWSPRTPRP